MKVNIWQMGRGVRARLWLEDWEELGPAGRASSDVRLT
jgi:hypothetical protein